VGTDAEPGHVVPGSLGALALNDQYRVTEEGRVMAWDHETLQWVETERALPTWEELSRRPWGSSVSDDIREDS
jgi:hypothetical protein